MTFASEQTAHALPFASLRWVIAGLAGLLLLASAQAAMPRPQAVWLAQSIWWAEGGDHSSKPYGLTLRPHQDARAACLRRLDCEWEAWQAAGRPGADFVSWIGQTWAPVAGADARLNRNWIPNVRRLYLERSKKI